MWDATVSEASTSNFGTDWSQLDITPDQPAYANYVHPKPLRRKALTWSTFGRGYKGDRDSKKSKDDGFRRAEDSINWKHVDQKGTLNPRPRIAKMYGKMEEEPCAANYYSLEAAKTTFYRWPVAELGSKHRKKPQDNTPGPGSYQLPSGIELSPERKKRDPKAAEKDIKLPSEKEYWPGPCKYRPNFETQSQFLSNPRPSMPPKQRKGNSRVVLNTRNLDLMSNEKFANTLGVKFKGLRKSQELPGPGSYDIAIHNPDKIHKVNSRKDTIGEKRTYVIGQAEVNPVGPGQYNLDPINRFGIPETTPIASDATKQKMKTSSAVVGTNVPWPELIDKEQIKRVKSNQMTVNYKSQYSFPKPKSTMILMKGSIRNKGNMAYIG